MDEKKDILTTLLDFVDAVTELYCQALMQVLESLPATAVDHEPILVSLRERLDDNVVPTWFTKKFITYVRASLVIPSLLFLSWGHSLVPFLLVVAFCLGRLLSDAVESYWDDVKKTESKDAERKDKPKSPVNPDADGFEVVTTGSPHSLPSWVTLHRKRSYSDFAAFLCERFFLTPVWISFLEIVPSNGSMNVLQYLALLWLMIAETAIACSRFYSFYTSGGVVATRLERNNDASAKQMSGAKEVFELLGTALFVLPLTRYFGTLLLVLAVPLAYESLRRATVRRVVYVSMNASTTVLDHKTLRFWNQAKSMGSTLLVGVVGSKAKETVLNARACSCVDQVIAEAPQKADLIFLERQGIDFVVAAPSQQKFVTDEVVNAHRYFTVGEDGVMRPVEPKVDHRE